MTFLIRKLRPDFTRLPEYQRIGVTAFSLCERLRRQDELDANPAGERKPQLMLSGSPIIRCATMTHDRNSTAYVDARRCLIDTFEADSEVTWRASSTPAHLLPLLDRSANHAFVAFISSAPSQGGF
ncbi:hypothetical protein [Paraburkholderia dinghuensis]|uniref:Uncharacterized protein n=1 Tax=Paraburkholderia dinghuensis TaxID=2305225 RepID=A0A3N6MVZ1_9BURK|nr:hypothetical protein [Paraburkholderia dinghuensis]RQH02161.1 hypothetical protein D1Y85_22020 [Paraburkholderia dinghuensis]